MQSGERYRKRKEEEGGGNQRRAQLTYQGHPQASEMPSRNSCRPTSVIAVDGGGVGPVHADYHGDKGKISDQVSTCFSFFPPSFTRTNMHID